MDVESKSFYNLPQFLKIIDVEVKGRDFTVDIDKIFLFANTNDTDAIRENMLKVGALMAYFSNAYIQAKKQYNKASEYFKTWKSRVARIIRQQIGERAADEKVMDFIRTKYYKRYSYFFGGSDSAYILTEEMKRLILSKQIIPSQGYLQIRDVDPASEKYLKEHQQSNRNMAQFTNKKIRKLLGNGEYNKADERKDVFKYGILNMLEYNKDMIDALKEAMKIQADMMRSVSSSLKQEMSIIHRDV